MPFVPFWRLAARRRLHRREMRGAFTLIELLIVVAIIAILAAIAVPNFLEAQTRAKVSRVQNDLRTLATGLESYAVDHGRYPPRSTVTTGLVVMGDSLRRREDLRRLTTPIGYLGDVPVDVFENRIAFPNNVLDYWTIQIVEGLIDALTTKPRTSQYGWALFSVGPDTVFGRGTFNFGNFPPEPDANAGTHFRFDYDPTNGTVSFGNIYRFQSQVGAIRVFSN
jgi:type II secretion system protein G